MDGDLYHSARYRELNPTWHAEDSPWKAEQVARLLRERDLTPTSICDVGCGAGLVLASLAGLLPEPAELTGIDVSEEAIAMARGLGDVGVEYRVGDISELADGAFEMILCIDVFEHVDDYLGFLRNLRPKARYKLFHIPLDITVQAVLRVSPFVNHRRQLGHLHSFTRETALATLEDAGYLIIEERFTTGAVDLPAKTRLQALTRWPRKILGAISPGLAARTLGGYSLLVLTE